MKARSITPPNRLEVWSIKISEFLEMPDWVSRFAIQGLGTLPRQVWLRPAKAKLLLALDRSRRTQRVLSCLAILETHPERPPTGRMFQSV
jgi:hypothetical protein